MAEGDPIALRATEPGYARPLVELCTVPAQHLCDVSALVLTDLATDAVHWAYGTAHGLLSQAGTLLQRISPNDFSNEAFPYGTAQKIEIGIGLGRAHRVSYVGELGWEIYTPTDQAAHIFEEIEVAGADLGLKLYGLHAMDSCRIKKAFRHDITDEDHVLKAGLGFAVNTATIIGAGRQFLEITPF